jgi:protein transport protein SEC24
MLTYADVCWCSLNDVRAEYYCNLDQSGKRRDHAERPELNYGSVEYVAPADYMVLPYGLMH